jgi:hypothetical protein
MRKIIAVIFLIAAVVSCVSVDCPVQNKVETLFVLKKAAGGADTMGIDSLSVWTHRIYYKDKQDTTLINRLCGEKTQFAIPASHTLTEDSLFTLLKDTLGHEWRDTICISKENYPHFESVDCQATYFHHITGVKTTHNGIDSITIQNREVNYESAEHFFLYLKANR